MTCPHCVHLSHENKRLVGVIKRLKARSLQSTPITPLSLGFTQQQETIIEALWAAQGAGITSALLSFALGNGSSKASVRVQINRIRAKLGPDTIKNRYGAGYYFTPEGLGILLEIMKGSKSD
jgi:DNA-binding response OmpR family regulator